MSGIHFLILNPQNQLCTSQISTFQFGPATHISGAQKPHVARGYYIRQHVLEDPFLVNLKRSQNTVVLKKNYIS